MNARSCQGISMGLKKRYIQHNQIPISKKWTKVDKFTVTIRPKIKRSKNDDSTEIDR